MGQFRDWKKTSIAGPRQDPSLRWLTQNSVGLDLQLEDISEAGGVSMQAHFGRL